MAMDNLVMRGGIWFFVAFILLLASAAGVDWAFSVHMAIGCIAALIAGFASGSGFDFVTQRFPALSPQAASTYDDDLIRWGVIATVFWGLAGFAVGLFIALQLAFPALNLNLEYTTFGRLRPLHTSAVIFAFGGSALLTTSFYVVQRTCRARLAFPSLARFVFWGYQLFIVLAATGYLMGVTEAKEYAEPEWYVDLWLTVVWVSYLIVFVGTIMRRKEPHIYVANWFYLAFIITVAMLHLVNNLSMPASLFGSKSYSAFAGVQDALTQWWYGHNAVGFFLTAGFLAMMYYFVPKQAERPVYSYRLSIIHFWSLIFLYIWAGPHHLHYTALPDWAQTLGMVFSIMLWMPSWGGMINGLMTLNGAWDKIRTDPIIRMFVMSLAFYGMSTFEGPMLSIKAVNSLSHYTDWTIGHVHSGALGWNGMVTFACLYFLAPRLWNRQRLYSLRMVNWHFWLASAGIVFYASAMWVSGIMQGLMWREYGADGYLVYSFVETVDAMLPMYLIRAFGGLLYLTGAVVMTINLWKTIAGSPLRQEAAMTETPYNPEADRPAVAVPAE
jgi:cytochrome c oxidase cbb3-type subunit I